MSGAPTTSEIGPGVRCLVASNGSLMTGPGTNTYLVGTDNIAVIDPGPLDDRHTDRILEAGDGRIRWICATHTHRDHSPGVAPLAALTGATVVGVPGAADSWNDVTFEPDIQPADGQVLATEQWQLQAIHTPGHASNHVCYLLLDQGLLFTGDHIMNGSTVVIAPPDGDMTAYLDSLRKIRVDDVLRIAPGHGEPMESPHAVIDWIIRHRLQRESLVLAAVEQLQDQPASLDDLVVVVYEGLDHRLISMAKRSLEAHLLKLQLENRVALQDDDWRANAEVSL